MMKSKPSFNEERNLWAKNVSYVIGIDEVGRGAFAGPIVAGAVIFAKLTKITQNSSFLKDINDSKLLKPKIRIKLSGEILKHAKFSAIEEVDIKTINKLGIGIANKMVFRRVVKKILSDIELSTGIKLKKSDYFLLSDGLRINYIKGINSKNHKAIIDGDKKSVTIGAASIIAKVYRDNLMEDLGKIYPKYNFSKNKGYGTKSHQEALKNFGLSNVHRKSFNLDKFLTL